MKTVAAFAAFVVLIPLVLSCGERSDTADSHADTAESDSYSQADAPGSDHGLVLNGGDKWLMDAHTRSMFAEMAASFAGDSGSVTATGEKIRGQIDELLQGCSMTGEAHDQLHTYLMVYIPAVEEMARGGTKTQADNVGELLQLYPKYFE